jgi:hypothetical protein
MGGVVGCAIVAPIVLYRHRSNAAESAPALVQAMFRTVLATTAISGTWPPQCSDASLQLG